MAGNVPLDLEAVQATLDSMYRIHVNAFCDDECSFCKDLVTAPNTRKFKHYRDEYRRILKVKKKRLERNPAPVRETKLNVEELLADYVPEDKPTNLRKKASGRKVAATHLPAKSSRPKSRRSKYWLY